MKQKLFRGTMHFDKAELCNLAIHDAGIQMGWGCADNTSKQMLIDTLKGAESFGIFGGGADTNKFYPQINSASDIVPKPEDFISVPFRLLTATIVGAGTWKATDFSNASKLKSSMSMLSGKPVYRNHDLEVDNFVGYIQGVTWENASTQNDIVVPAGINGILAIDAKTEPKLARGVLMGAIYSNSVTVEFDWEMSHPFEDEWEFLNKVGTLAQDGTMIRRIVKTIYNYHETSLVFLGADPFAKLIGEDGKLKNIDTASIEYDKADATEKDKWKNEKRLDAGRDGLGLNIDLGVLYLAKEKLKTVKPEEGTVIEQQENKPDMKELLVFLCLKFGKKAEEITEANFMTYVNQLDVAVPKIGTFQKKAGLFDSMVQLAVVNTADDKETKLTLTGTEETTELPEKLTENYVMVSRADFSALRTQAGTLTTEKTALEKDATIGKGFVQMKRDEAIRLYKLNMGEKFSEAVVTLIKEAEGDALEGLVTQYTKGVGAKFQATCTHCNSSEHISFKSSVSSEGGEGNAEVATPKAVSVRELHAKYDQSPMHITRKN